MSNSEFLAGLFLGLALSLVALGVFFLFGSNAFSPKRSEEEVDRRPYVIWPLAISLLLLLLVVSFLFVLNVNIFDQTAWFEFENGERKGSAESIRSIFLTIGGMIAVPFTALTLGNAMRRSATMERQEVIARRLQLNDSRRLEADAFTRATEMLGSERIDQRVAAVHSLQLLAKSVERSVADQIADSLSAFVRSRSAQLVKNAENGAGWLPDESLRTAINVLVMQLADGERKISLRGAVIEKLYISGTLKGVDFSGCSLERLDVVGEAIDCVFDKIRSDPVLIFRSGLANSRLTDSKISSLQIGMQLSGGAELSMPGGVLIANSIIGAFRMQTSTISGAFEIHNCVFGSISLAGVKGLDPDCISEIGVKWPTSVTLPRIWKAEVKAEFMQKLAHFHQMPTELTKEVFDRLIGNDEGDQLDG